MPPIWRRLARARKKSSNQYTAQRAAKGIRTFKSGQSVWFVGYKKHSLRLWLSHYGRGVLLVPLVSWVAPANVYEGQFLVPSLRHCERRWSWWPRYVVADMAFLPAAIKGECRRQWQVAVVTKLRTGMKRIEPFVTSTQATCRQEQPLTWLGYDAQAQEHCFGVTASEPLCSGCWEASHCPRQFTYPAGDHETLLGVLPLFTRPAQRMLKQMRSWIEPVQSYEKNQLGLNQMFLNSLRLTWWMALLADATCLLRASALLDEPRPEHYLQELLPEQLSWNWS